MICLVTVTHDSHSHNMQKHGIGMVVVVGREDEERARDRGERVGGQL